MFIFIQWRIEDLPEGASIPKGGDNPLFDQFFSEIWMKMKKFLSRRGALPLPPPITTSANGMGFQERLETKTIKALKNTYLKCLGNESCENNIRVCTAQGNQGVGISIPADRENNDDLDVE